MKNNKLKILAFASSLRQDSYNKMALKVATEGIRKAGSKVETINLKDLNIPFYDGDLEREGLPEGVVTLKQKVKDADGVLIATPEYNHSLPAVLKNALDWVSRPPKNEFEGKPVAIFGASPGHFGSVRAQIAFYPVATDLQIYLMPSKVYITNADQKFDSEGKLLDEKVKEKLYGLAKDFIEFTKKLTND